MCGYIIQMNVASYVDYSVICDWVWYALYKLLCLCCVRIRVIVMKWSL